MITTWITACVLSGCLLLSLSQLPPLMRQRWFLHHPRRQTNCRRLLRLAGSIMLCLSLWLACQHPYPGYALTQWFGLFSLAGIMVASLLALTRYWLKPTPTNRRRKG